MAKKFKGTKMSLADLGAVEPVGLPKAPVEREGNEESYDRRGFKIRDEGSRYGGGRNDRYGDREGPGGEDVSNWRDREGPSGGFGDRGDRDGGPRRGFGGFDKDRDAGGADEGDWRSGDRGGFGGRDRDRGGFGGGFREREDRGDRDRGFGGGDRDRGFGGGDRDRGFGGGRREFDAGGDRGKSWGSTRGGEDRESDEPRGGAAGGADRPRLKLAPRTAPLPETRSPEAKPNAPSPPPQAAASKPKSNPFGAAKPREEVLKEKGVPVPAEEPPRRASPPRRVSPPRRAASPPRRAASPPRRSGGAEADKWERVGPVSEGRGRATDREPPKDKRSPSPLPASVQSNIAERLKKEVDMIVGEYLLNAEGPGAVDEAVRSMEELWMTGGDDGEGDSEAEVAPIVIKRTITIALEKKRSKELGEISKLIGALRKRSAVSRQSLERGLERVLDSVMDLKLDLPDAPKLTGEFLGLAVAGQFLDLADIVDLFPETLALNGEAGYMVVDALHKIADELGDKEMKEIYWASKPRFEPLFGGKSAKDYLSTKGLKFLFQ
eukprot:tig00000204_g17695.t1